MVATVVETGRQGVWQQALSLRRQTLSICTIVTARVGVQVQTSVLRDITLYGRTQVSKIRVEREEPPKSCREQHVETNEKIK